MSTIDIISRRVERAMREAGLNFTVTNTGAPKERGYETAVLIPLTPNGAEQFITWLGER